MKKLFAYIQYRIGKLQKSQKKVFFRAVRRICLLWILSAVFLCGVCWNSRTAGPDNTEIIVVNGTSVSRFSRARRNTYSTFVFTCGDQEYRASWIPNFSMSARQAFTDLQQEDEIQLTVLKGSHRWFTYERVVDIRGKTKHYLDIDAYNRHNFWTRILVFCIAIPFDVAATVFLSLRIFWYLKPEQMKHFRPPSD